jgi:dephospho-CoA kinase
MAIDQPIAQIDYDAAWPDRFEAIRVQLAPLFGAEATIEHTGSTAVPGLSGTDVIDVLVLLPALPVSFASRDALEALGYHEHAGIAGG